MLPTLHRRLPLAHPSHVVVIGGSMAGLLAARVLADRFERVTIVERDRYPVGPAPRRGVPQARHAHILLSRGQRILEQLFPGLQAELVASGAALLDAAGDAAVLTPSGPAERFHSGLSLLSASRDLLEWSVRRRLAAMPAIRFIEEADVLGLLANAAGTAVEGVSIRRRNSPGAGAADAEHLAASLVVDASGRGSRAPQWLEALGYAAPEETTVNSFLGYASRVYQRPSRSRGDWKALFVQSKPPEGTRYGLIVPVEGDRWIVTLSGRGGDYPPTDEAGFLAFVRSLPSSALYDAIQDATPLGPIAGFRNTENRVRHYERLPCGPEGFVVLGDAACAFNPVYGQCMTSAAMGALTLAECLSEGGRSHRGSLPAGLAKRFQEKLARSNRAAWQLATGEDCRYPTTEGDRPNWCTRLLHRYVDCVIRLSTKHAGVRLQLLEVLHLLRPATALFSPRVWLPMLARTFRAPFSWDSGTGLAEVMAKPTSSRATLRLNSALS